MAQQIACWRAGNDVLIGGAGDMSMEAKEIHDCRLLRAQLRLTTVTHCSPSDDDRSRLRGIDGTDTVRNVEQLQFADRSFEIQLATCWPKSRATMFESAEDEVVVLSAADLLANDIDLDGDQLTLVGVQDAENGTVRMLEDGSIEFVPDAEYSRSTRASPTPWSMPEVESTPPRSC
ncbi:MAG: cadherin-like domain-containing protein [Pirellulaceae bacterium]